MDEDSVLSTPESYSELREKPESLLQFVNKCCTIQLIKNISFSGFIHSIDPVSKSVILAIPQENTFQITLIPGHAIENLSEKCEESLVSPFKILDDPSSVDIVARKIRVMKWLSVNLLPVSESNNNIVFGNVIILPPYTVTNICTDNPIVAMQVRKIIEEMPQDFE